MLKRPPSLPLVTAVLGGGGALLAGAVPEPATTLALTGNPAIDAMLVVGVLTPAMAALGWAVKFTCGAGVNATAAALRSWADFVEARAKASKDTGDDAPAHAGAVFARAFAAQLERAQLPRKGLTPGVTNDRRHDAQGEE